MNGIHRALLKISGGRIGWEASKMPVLELTTTGRRLMALMLDAKLLKSSIQIEKLFAPAPLETLPK